MWIAETRLDFGTVEFELGGDGGEVYDASVLGEQWDECLAHLWVISSPNSSYTSAQGGTHVQHSGVVDVHRLLRVSGAVLVVEVHAGIVDEHIYTAVLRDFFGKVLNTAAIRDIQLWVYYATGGVVRLKPQVLS